MLPSVRVVESRLRTHSAAPCLQITALIFLPSFPGWLAPLAFNPVRFLEFFSFTATLLGTWVAAGAAPRLAWCLGVFTAVLPSAPMAADAAAVG